MGSFLGIQKRVAQLTKLSLYEYQQKISSGFKYCYGCKGWKQKSEFATDLSRGDKLKSLCRPCVKGKGYSSRKRIQSVEKVRAHRAIQMRVRRGTLPHPDTINCSDCGHIGNDRRHEYDHYNGYQGEAKFQVQAVCSMCHASRHKLRKTDLNEFPK